MSVVCVAVLLCLIVFCAFVGRRVACWIPPLSPSSAHDQSTANHANNKAKRNNTWTQHIEGEDERVKECLRAVCALYVYRVCMYACICMYVCVSVSLLLWLVSPFLPLFFSSPQCSPPPRDHNDATKRRRKEEQLKQNQPNQQHTQTIQTTHIPPTHAYGVWCLVAHSCLFPLLFVACVVWGVLTHAPSQTQPKKHPPKPTHNTTCTHDHEQGQQQRDWERTKKAERCMK